MNPSRLLYPPPTLRAVIGRPPSTRFLPSESRLVRVSSVGHPSPYFMVDAACDALAAQSSRALSGHLTLGGLVKRLQARVGRALQPFRRDTSPLRMLDEAARRAEAAAPGRVLVLESAGLADSASLETWCEWVSRPEPLPLSMVLLMPEGWPKGAGAELLRAVVLRGGIAALTIAPELSGKHPLEYALRQLAVAPGSFEHRSFTLTQLLTEALAPLQAAITVPEALEPVLESDLEPVVAPILEPVAQSMAEPVAELIAEPVAELMAEPVAELIAEPVLAPAFEAPPTAVSPREGLLEVPVELPTEGQVQAPAEALPTEALLDALVEALIDPQAEAPVVEPVGVWRETTVAEHLDVLAEDGPATAPLVVQAPAVEAEPPMPTTDTALSSAPAVPPYAALLAAAQAFEDDGAFEEAIEHMLDTALVALDHGLATDARGLAERGHGLARMCPALPTQRLLTVQLLLAQVQASWAEAARDGRPSERGAQDWLEVARARLKGDDPVAIQAQVAALTALLQPDVLAPGPHPAVDKALKHARDLLEPAEGALERFKVLRRQVTLADSGEVRQAPLSRTQAASIRTLSRTWALLSQAERMAGEVEQARAHAVLSRRARNVIGEPSVKAAAGGGTSSSRARAGVAAQWSVG